MRRKVFFEENGVRVILDHWADPIEVGVDARMSVEEARALIASIERAIGCYCHQLEIGNTSRKYLDTARR